MRRDENLLLKLLLLAEGGEPKPDLSGYTEEQQAYHAAILIDSGLLAGETVKDHTGQVRGAVIVDLTPAGHDFLERYRRAPSPTAPSKMEAIEIFVSHSQHDQDLAKALIELLMEALNIPRTGIRCTSVIGHQLRGGAAIEPRLRQEINESRIFVGLLTPSSLKSTYVMFELGARWGIEKYWYLIKARGTEIGDLQGPLPAYYVPDASSESDLAQMVEAFAMELATVPQNLAVFQERIKTVVRVANLRTPIEPQHAASMTSRVGYDDEDILTVLTGWVGDNLYSLNNQVITFSKLDAELGLPSGACMKHLETVAKNAGAKLIRRGKETILFESPIIQSNDAGFIDVS
jgi:TIR domain/Hypothetical protein (DUF2513)